MFTKNCPDCGCLQSYATKKALNFYIKKNKKCRSCVMKGKYTGKKLTEENKIKISESSRGENKDFYGKKHSAETRHRLTDQKLGKKLTEEHKESISNGMKGEKNPMYNKSLYDIWLNKYGKEIADQKLIEFKQKISNATSSKNNPMFGKPSPKGSGNGWKGWYNGIFFRSLLELSFLVNYIERFNMKWESAEQSKWAISYFKPTGDEATYFADYIINDRYMVEIKPKSLVNTPMVKAKSLEAMAYCEAHGLKYKIITPQKLKETNILELHKNNKIKFTKYYEDRFRKEFILA